MSDDCCTSGDRRVVHSQDLHWEPTDVEGIECKSLCMQDEGGTWLLRFQQGAEDSLHRLTEGQELFVLEGVLSDVYGDYGRGCYLRNPPGKPFQVWSEQGCILFIKVGQFPLEDTHRFHTQFDWVAETSEQIGLDSIRLHHFRTCYTSLVFWPANESLPRHQHLGGEEILVLDGCFEDEFGIYPAGTWIQSPDMSVHAPKVKENTILLVKIGHLLNLF